MNKDISIINLGIFKYLLLLISVFSFNFSISQEYSIEHFEQTKELVRSSVMGDSQFLSSKGIYQNLTKIRINDSKTQADFAFFGGGFDVLNSGEIIRMSKVGDVKKFTIDPYNESGLIQVDISPQVIGVGYNWGEEGWNQYFIIDTFFILDDKTIKERDKKIINEFLSNQSDKDYLEKYNQSQNILKKIHFKNTDYYTSFLKMSEDYKKKYEDQNDEKIGVQLKEKINNRDIKSLPNFREVIKKDVFSIENKNRFLKELESGIKSFNDSLLVVFSSALENKNKELISSSMNNLVEYEYKEELINKVLEKFDLNRTLSITNTERFKDYFINFSVNTFPFFTVYNENAIINFEIIDGKIKSSTGHKLDYTFSDDEKIILEPFLFFKISPKLESFTIKKNVKLVTLNKTYIHDKKDSKTLFVDKQTLDQEEKTTFRGGKWKPKLIFSKDRFSNSELIKTRSIESLRNKIKLNINETFGFKLTGKPGKFKASIVEDMNSYFNNSISQNITEGYFSKDKKVVNVYTEWVYELYINDKKINEIVKTKFNKSSPFSSISKTIYFNKPFYTVDVFEVF